MNRDTCGICGAPNELCKCAGLADPDVRAEVRAHIEPLTVEELRCAVVLQRLEIDRLRKEKAYQLIGTIDGTYAGRWMLAAFAENAAAVWPDGTAVYVRRRVEE